MEEKIHRLLVNYFLVTPCSKISSDIGVSHRKARYLKESTKRTEAGEKEGIANQPAQLAKLITFFLTELNQSSSERVEDV